MLPKKLRLPIQEVISKKGKTHKNTFFTIKVFSNNLNFSRFGVVISKKVGKTAVVRNKIKRAIFNALRSVKDHWAIADYLIIVNSSVIGLSQKQINGQIISLSFN